MASKLTLEPSYPKVDYVKAIQSYQKKKEETILRIMRGEFRNAEERFAYMIFRERFFPSSPRNALSGAGAIREAATNITPVYRASNSRVNISSHGLQITPSFMRLTGIPADAQIVGIVVCDEHSSSMTASEIERIKELFSGVTVHTITVEDVRDIPTEIAQILRTCSLAKRV